MRLLYIVAYDVTDDRRWRQVFKLMRGYGDHLQYSVFRCELSDQERIVMMDRLSRVIKHDQDQVLFFPLGPAGGVNEQRVYALGLAYRSAEHAPVIV
jgi:CRISPR-associated protein Cas2